MGHFLMGRALMGQALVGLRGLLLACLGSCGPGPHGLPWGLMAMALIGPPRALMGRALTGPRWALMGWTLMGRALMAGHSFFSPLPPCLRPPVMPSAGWMGAVLVEEAAPVAYS